MILFQVDEIISCVFWRVILIGGGAGYNLSTWTYVSPSLSRVLSAKISSLGLCWGGGDAGLALANLCRGPDVEEGMARRSCLSGTGPGGGLFFGGGGSLGCLSRDSNDEASPSGCLAVPGLGTGQSTDWQRAAVLPSHVHRRQGCKAHSTHGAGLGKGKASSTCESSFL